MLQKVAVRNQKDLVGEVPNVLHNPVILNQEQEFNNLQKNNELELEHHGQNRGHGWGRVGDLVAGGGGGTVLVHHDLFRGAFFY